MSNNNNGWICLYRSFREWQHYGEPYIKAVFLDLLINANHKEGWWHGHKCERGATFMSIRTIAENNNISIKTAHKCLRTLELTGEIKRIKIDQKHTKTVICKYAQYQDNNLACVIQHATQGNTQGNTQSNTKQQYNNNNNSVVVDNARAHEEKVEAYMGNQITLERFCMAEHITQQDFRKLVDEVVTEWELTSESDTSKRHMVNTMRVKLRAKREAEKNQSKADKRKAWEDDLMAGASQTLNEIYKN